MHSWILRETWIIWIPGEYIWMFKENMTSASLIWTKDLKKNGLWRWERCCIVSCPTLRHENPKQKWSTGTIETKRTSAFWAISNHGAERHTTHRRGSRTGVWINSREKNLILFLTQCLPMTQLSLSHCSLGQAKNHQFKVKFQLRCWGLGGPSSSCIGSFTNWKCKRFGPGRSTLLSICSLNWRQK